MNNSMARAPNAYFIYPPFAFYRASSLINRSTYGQIRQPFAWYLDQIYPSEYGVLKKWDFPLTELLRYKNERLGRKKSEESKIEGFNSERQKIVSSDFNLEIIQS